jgi:plasmid stability protein
MPALTIKNIPRELHKRLKQSAVLHRRSVNSEAIACLERVLTCTRADPEEYLARVRAARARLTKIYVTDKDLREAKNWGRL